jgi:hypothetical protein
MAGGEELVAAADAEVEVTRGLFREGEAEGFCFLLGSHDGEGEVDAEYDLENENWQTVPFIDHL